ncbi:TetR family transcriptional regulator [Nonomuraea turkmeniaca]|nr:TetR family transcriptional regulator [Nonomuraea turkmeniaca]
MMSLREMKKEQTRQLIADTAWRLFAEQGFDDVTVAEVAREAQVAKATVFNYFPTKEDLFYAPFDAFGTRLIEAIAGRPAGESVLMAFQRFLLNANGLLDQVEAGDEAALQAARTVARVIAGSAALQAREQQAMKQHTDSLARLLATETGAAEDDPGPQVAANALMGVHRTLTEHARRRIAEDRTARLGTDIRTLCVRSCALLERGLADYAPALPQS